MECTKYPVSHEVQKSCVVHLSNVSFGADCSVFATYMINFIYLVFIVSNQAFAILLNTGSVTILLFKNITSTDCTGAHGCVRKTTLKSDKVEVFISS